MLSKQEERILKLIPKAISGNGPAAPEFPADNPKFPATPTYQIQYKKFSQLFLKDESFNPTGTHKDRLAWELVCQYRHYLEAKKMVWLTDHFPSFL